MLDIITSHQINVIDIKHVFNLKTAFKLFQKYNSLRNDMIFHHGLYSLVLTNQ